MASETVRDDMVAAMVRSVPGRTPLVFDSPHSGTNYPGDFAYSCDFALLRTAEDTHVEKLYDFAPSLGIAWIEALFPRSYLDANRGEHEVDVEMLDGRWEGEVVTDPVALSKVRLGKGLVWKNTDTGEAMYSRKLRPQEVRQRIDRCWRPYHQAVQRAIEEAHARHGYSVHLNCHSMPSVAGSHATDHPGIAHADFVLGDRDGSTADPRLTAQLAEFLRSRGYDVKVNFPYKGVELVRRYGEPARQRHSIQVEVNRKRYMDERTFELLAAAKMLREDLKAMAQWLLGVDPRRM
ncbi:N-formylglutamate amidohydrolase [Ramlibacter henchirensis]|uniref:N-formylglutamate amidohydrolase n=1 Tax=Ramlibacter henchirensis TaxID=204072 RepID=A0A4Z0C3L9_9BURK|nr:N-formylglutamate amidohydrolase [Ramlibacter henchirensis]TFZ06267.1 N-formylglutamate amidohydrolase [Ramlibacter henchirensis]